MRYRLTPAIEETILQYIRAGGFDWVAAEAAGIPRAEFERWLGLGLQGRGQKYRRFYERVTQATAQARLKAEIEAHKKDPRSWLKHGPGREQKNQPGWTNAATANIRQDKKYSELLASPEFQQVCKDLLQVLQKFPEAKAAVVEMLGKKEKECRGRET